MKRYRALISIAVLCFTIGVFGYFLATHPEMAEQLKNLEFKFVLPVLVLYLLFTFFLSLAVKSSVALCGKSLPYLESFKLTSSSSLANFFGPLQSGPGVRALYLKKKYGITLKKFGLATLYYYGFYAVISGVFLLSGDKRFRLPLICLLLIGSAGTIFFLKKKQAAAISFHPKVGTLVKLAGATTLQLSTSVLIFWIELAAIGVQMSFSQILSYTGAANLALFVSLTPGAIGFREAFLVFSQSLHHVSSNDIIAANILDRAIYLIFLGLLFAWLVATHTRKQFLNRNESTEGR